MSDDLDYDLEGDVTLDQDEKNVGGSKSDWLKLATKGQILRVAFCYFHTFDANAVGSAAKEARKAGKILSKEDIAGVAKKTLTDLAQKLNKSVDQLTPIDRLDLKVAHFKSLKAHYQEGFGYAISRLGKDGPEADAIWRRLPEAKPYFTTLLLIYPTDDQGNLHKEVFGQQIRDTAPKLVPWRFSKMVYDEIWNLNEGLRGNAMTLGSQDIKLECKEPKYQNIKVSFAGPALWQKNDTIKQVVLSKAVTMYGDKLLPFREMTTDQLKAKLGLGGSAVQDVATDDFQDLIGSV